MGSEVINQWYYTAYASFEAITQIEHCEWRSPLQMSYIFLFICECVCVCIHIHVCDIT